MPATITCTHDEWCAALNRVQCVLDGGPVSSEAVSEFNSLRDEANRAAARGESPTHSLTDFTVSDMVKWYVNVGRTPK